jgi:hypothetical protein
VIAGMMKEGVRPNVVTYTSLMDGYLHMCWLMGCVKLKWLMKPWVSLMKCIVEEF